MADTGLTTLVAILLVNVLVFHFSRTYWRLLHIPGPFVAQFTDLWRLYIVSTRRAETKGIELHAKYGDVVRIGPNCVSICKPDLVQSIYGVGKGYVKVSVTQHLFITALAV